MKKNYFYIALCLFLFSFAAVAQENKDGALISKSQEQPFENLNIYPNPTSGDRVYIASKSASPKNIEVFDVLGKRIMQVTITNKELNVSSLSPGVYIIKIKEGDVSATRKLIIK